MITEILIVTAIALILLQYLSVKRPLNFPPGPSGIPLLGYAPFLRSPFSEGFEELSKKYGNIFGIFLGTYPVVVLSDLNLVKEAFGNERMSGRPQFRLSEDCSYGGGRLRGIISTSGKVWKEQRRFTMRNLREFGFGKPSMETMIMEEVTDLINGLRKELNRPVFLGSPLMMASMNSMWYILSGERCTHDDHNIASHIHKFTDVPPILPPDYAKLTRYRLNTLNPIWGNDGITSVLTKQLGAIRTACTLFTPSIAKVFPEVSGFKYLLASLNEAYSFLKEVVDSHKRTLDIENPRDFIDAFLQEIEKTTDLMSSFWKEEGEKQLLTTLLDLTLTGADTTSATMNWALLYLVTNPDIQEKIHTEIVTIVGTNRIPSLADRPRMPYTEAVISETLRLSSIAPLGVPRRTTKEMEINGYTIPKNTTVIANIRQIHFDKDRWGDPETFRPERFINNDGLFRPNEALIPFSVGKRMCPAENLAKDQLFLFLASLIQQLRFDTDIRNIPTLHPVPTPLIRVSHPYNVVITIRKSSVSK